MAISGGGCRFHRHHPSRRPYRDQHRTYRAGAPVPRFPCRTVPTNLYRLSTALTDLPCRRDDLLKDTPKKNHRENLEIWWRGKSRPALAAPMLVSEMINYSRATDRRRDGIAKRDRRIEAALNLS
jgi:hypothetical protein